jgi:hypothetical protein
MKLWRTIPAIVVLIAGVGACADEPRGAGSGGAYDAWACAPNRIAQTTFTLDYSASGQETRDAALLVAAELLANDGVADEEALAEAAAAPAADSGLLVIQGEIVADVSLTQLEDGTWSIAGMLHCTVPATGGTPGPTPVDGNDAAA